MLNERPRSWSWVLLFTTSATLTCCALPILLVSLGFGAAVASVAGAVPWLVELSLHKSWIFAGSGLMIIAAAGVIHRPGRICPTDPELALACARADVWNRRFLWLSAAIWSLGFAAAYLLG